MLLRTIADGWLAISQPAHARLAAQLAVAWSATWAPALMPREGVVAGTFVHDIGWLEWEAAPTLNPDTGLPHTFLELPIASHIAMWRRAAVRAWTFGRYPALLTSMHGTRLYASRDLTRLDPSDAALVSDFLDSERRRQAELIDQLASDARTREWCDQATLARMSDYVALFDALSLALCGGVREERSFRVPSTDGYDNRLWLRPRDDGSLTVEPWPFADVDVEVVADARLITERYGDEGVMRNALACAPWRLLTVRLVPA